MSVQDSELQKLITDLPFKEGRARKRHLTYTLIALMVGGGWLAYSFYAVSKLRAESQALRVQIDEQRESLEETKKELNAKNQELETIAQQLRIPLEDLQNLRNFGFLSGAQSGSDLSAYVEQSTKAKAALQDIKSPNDQKARRANIAIRYFIRDTDNGRVAQAVESLEKDYGFSPVPNELQKEPNTYSNAIWIMRPNSVNEEDIKLIAYYLILRGIQIKYIGRPTSTPQRVRSAREAIWIVAEPKAKDEPPLTVERIKDLSLPSFLQGTKTIDW